MAYNAQTDYEKLIQQAAAQKDYLQAAVYEQARNEKIAGEGLDYAPTNRYLNYLNQTPTSGISVAPLQQVSVAQYSSPYTEQLQAAVTKLQQTEVPQYSSPYAAGIQSAISELQSTKWGGWDKDTDPSYQAYRKEYLREADRTQEDTMGEYAAMTGGMPSSAAITAASQAGDYYKSQLTDKIPELYQNAYQRYLGDLQAKQNTLSQQISAENANVNQFYQQASAERLARADAVEALLSAENANINQFYQQASAERLAAAQNESQYYNQINAAMNKWQQLGYADADVANVLGVGLGTTTADQAYAAWDQAFQERQYQDKLDEQAAKALAKQLRLDEKVWEERKDELTEMASEYYFAHRNAASNDLIEKGLSSYTGLMPGTDILGSYVQNKYGISGREAEYFSDQLQGYIDKFGTSGKIG